MSIEFQKDLEDVREEASGIIVRASYANQATALIKTLDKLIVVEEIVDERDSINNPIAYILDEDIEKALDGQKVKRLMRGKYSKAYHYTINGTKVVFKSRKMLGGSGLFPVKAEIEFNEFFTEVLSFYTSSHFTPQEGENPMLNGLNKVLFGECDFK